MKLFRNKTETEISTEPQQTILKNKLSIGVRILGALFIVCGGIWISIFFSQVGKGYLPYMSKVDVLLYILPGSGMLIGGIGILNRKYWALKFAQVFLLILGVAFCLVMALPGVTFWDETVPTYFRFLQVILIFFVFFILPLWFLAKKSTVEQFKTHLEEQN